MYQANIGTVGLRELGFILLLAVLLIGIPLILRWMGTRDPGAASRERRRR